MVDSIREQAKAKGWTHARQVLPTIRAWWLKTMNITEDVMLRSIKTAFVDDEEWEVLNKIWDEFERLELKEVKYMFSSCFVWTINIVDQNLSQFVADHWQAQQTVHLERHCGIWWRSYEEQLSRVAANQAFVRASANPLSLLLLHFSTYSIGNLCWDWEIHQFACSCKHLEEYL